MMRVGSIAEAYSKSVVNVLTFGPTGAQEVLLEVKFAEVDRTALTQFGVNLLSTGLGKTIGATTTGQFGGLGAQRINDAFGVPASPPPTCRHRRPVLRPRLSAPSQINDVLNLFLFNPELPGCVVTPAEEPSPGPGRAEPARVNGRGQLLAG
jgi:hypothetical protein